MKHTLIALFILIALSVWVQKSFADCPCPEQTLCAQNPCACQNTCDVCCEDWLDCKCLENYFCRLDLNDCQKMEALNAIEKFKFETQCLREKGFKCENKSDCRCYKQALRNLDCKMKQIITTCQKSDYTCVRSEIKDKIKFCHKCLINPFYSCKCSCN